MITIIAGTNRDGSNTLKVATLYQQFFEELQTATQLLSLKRMTALVRNDDFNKIEAELLIPTQKFVFILPEYNGSFPGIFKLMMDISDVKKCWNQKKVMLVGVSDGRAGNARGLDVLTNMCHYLKMNVFYHKMPISTISTELQNDQFINPNTIQVIKQQITEFINY